MATLQEFFEMQTQWDHMQVEMRNIVEKHKSIKFCSPFGVQFDTSANKLYVNINAGEIPFGVITDLTEYIGHECDSISIAGGPQSYTIMLIWDFKGGAYE